MNESAKHEAQADARGHLCSGAFKGYDAFICSQCMGKGENLYTAPTDGVRRGMEMALAAVQGKQIKRLKTDQEIAYGDGVQGCLSAVEDLIAALPAQDAAKDDAGAQESQHAKDAADAARYRWLRKGGHEPSEVPCVVKQRVNGWGNTMNSWLSGKGLDKAIDAAMAASKGS